METFDRISRERHRIDALHDAIAIIVGQIGHKDLALRDSILRQLRAEQRKMEIEYPPDARGMEHARPLELFSLCESVQRFGRLPPDNWRRVGARAEALA